MDSDSEEDLKAMYPFGRKEVRKLEMPVDIVSEVPRILIFVFPFLTISQMQFPFPNP